MDVTAACTDDSSACARGSGETGPRNNNPSSAMCVMRLVSLGLLRHFHIAGVSTIGDSALELQVVPGSLELPEVDLTGDVAHGRPFLQGKPCLLPRLDQRTFCQAQHNARVT